LFICGYGMEFKIKVDLQSMQKKKQSVLSSPKTSPCGLLEWYKHSKILKSTTAASTSSNTTIILNNYEYLYINVKHAKFLQF
jgi:hypothetical protein